MPTAPVVGAGGIGTVPTTEQSPPLQRIWLLTLIPSRNKVPLCGGVPAGRGGSSPEASAKGGLMPTAQVPIWVRICLPLPQYRRGIKFPSIGGELSPQRERNKFPSAEGCPDTGPRENAIFVGGWGGVVHHE